MLLQTLIAAAAAAQLKVSPDPVRLRADAPRATLTVHNPGRKNLHVLATTWSWWQSASGETRLDPSAEIAISPAELYLAPRENKTVQISVAGAPSQVERAFRIELEAEEVQAFRRAPQPPRHTSVAVFVAPEQAAPAAEVGDLAVASGHLKFTVLNSGDAHFRVAEARVVLLGKRGERVALQTLPAWVVLARAQVNLDVPLPAKACRGAHSVTLELRGGASGPAEIRKTAAVTPAACAGN